MKLLSVNADAKTVKGLKKGYLTGILYLTPSPVLCPACSEGCRKACLFSAGHGRTTTVQRARMRRTQLFLKHRQWFINMLICDIKELVRTAKRKHLTPCVRLNGTSDIDVQKVFKSVLRKFSDVQFYDYTKVWTRDVTEPNYYLCYSKSENTDIYDITSILAHKDNVAVVFDEVPKTWYGLEVINGDESDLRFLDKRGIIVGLKAKGKALQDTTGFVVRTRKEVK